MNAISSVLEAEANEHRQIIKALRKIHGLLVQCGEAGLMRLTANLSFLDYNVGNPGSLEDMSKEIQADMREHDKQFLKKVYQLKHGKSGLQQLKEEIEAELAG